jgi:predicted phage terminase large subunit-like protein
MKPTSIGWTDPRTEPRELLWPAVPEQMKKAFGDFPPRLHAGQLQQRPVPEGGAMFKREWFRVVARVPPRAIKAVRYWDKAASENAGDYSAGVQMVQSDAAWYVADVIRGRWSVHQRNQIMRRTAENDAVRFQDLTTVIEQEPGSGGKESAEHSRRLLAGYHVKIDKVTGAKDIRAQPLADQCEGGNVFVVKADWNMRFIEELCVFPAGDYDDQVDAAAGAFTHSCRTFRFEPPTSIGLVSDPRRFGLQFDPNAGGGYRHGIQLDRRSHWWPH